MDYMIMSQRTKHNSCLEYNLKVF